MIRFIDLTEAYWTDPEGGAPICAFLDTTTNRFIALSDMGQHTLDSLEDFEFIESKELRERCLALLPKYFFGSCHDENAPDSEEPDGAGVNNEGDGPISGGGE